MASYVTHFGYVLESPVKDTECCSKISLLYCCFQFFYPDAVQKKVDEDEDEDLDTLIGKYMYRKENAG